MKEMISINAAQEMVFVNITRQADGSVFLSVNLKNGNMTVAAERIRVILDPLLPNPLDLDSQVSVWQDGKASKAH